EIDDAGTGDLVGDAFIGFLRKETNQMLFKRLPLELFQKEGWENKVCLKKVVDVVKEGLQELDFNHKNEKILLCRGNIFDELRAYFNDEGINYESAIIEGKLQDAIENRYLEHLKNDLGIRSNKLTTKSGAKRYFVLFNWVSYDFYNREKFVKSGFKRWNTIWRNKAKEKYEELKNDQK
ncbi:MAG: hypothetical protein ACFFKA_08230, partial [Candidatus Thorarchaeota archaeon]